MSDSPIAEHAISEEGQPKSLRCWILEQTDKPHPVGTEAFLDAIHTRWPKSVSAVIFYGSCRRSQHPDGLYDLYVLLDDSTCLPWGERMLLNLLPPNVYYLEVKHPDTGELLRSKTTLIRRRQFACGMHWFHSYLWARFCQPVTLVYCRDDQIRHDLLADLENAVRTFVRRALPLLPEQFDSETLWVTGLRASYRAELRSEGADRANLIYAQDAVYYAGVTASLPPHSGYSFAAADAPGRYHNPLLPVQKFLARLSWTLRRALGKLLSIARILKSWATFEGGLDYLVWKLERHSGQVIDIPQRVRRQPLLYLWPFFWRLYKQGIFR